jgi:F-type H+-transporting ATPase subunit epsilon
MHLEIVSPEQVLFSGEVQEVSVPGVNGEFQMLNNHAPVVSVLQKGGIKLAGDAEIPSKVESQFQNINGKKVFPIEGGVIELKDNKVTILVD